MNLELNNVRADALVRELQNITQNDRYPLSPRIVPLKEILAKLWPGARAPAATPETALRAAKEAAILAATRLAP